MPARNIAGFYMRLTCNFATCVAKSKRSPTLLTAAVHVCSPSAVFWPRVVGPQPALHFTASRQGHWLEKCWAENPRCACRMLSCHQHVCSLLAGPRFLDKRGFKPAVHVCNLFGQELKLLHAQCGVQARASPTRLLSACWY